MTEQITATAPVLRTWAWWKQTLLDATLNAVTTMLGMVTMLLMMAMMGSSYRDIGLIALASLVITWLGFVVTRVVKAMGAKTEETSTSSSSSGSGMGMMGMGMMGGTKKSK